MSKPKPYAEALRFLADNASFLTPGACDAMRKAANELDRLQAENDLLDRALTASEKALSDAAEAAKET